ncbi:MAG: hydroxymethylglutaryl-CoA reductase, degradative [Methanobacteriota archaeon]|nr:MAG: hydroxymethylglutaryl-CoA reductase, degradative [Euryarchaeota archaeon]
MKSSISGFYRLSPEERLKIVKEFSGLSGEETSLLSGRGLTLEQADRMIENVIGTIEVPVGIATNFLINGRDYLIPMATEEPSVVAAASNAAKIARKLGGFTTGSSEPVMIGQIQICKVPHMEAAVKAVEREKREILKMANEVDPVLVKFGGGAKDLQSRIIDTAAGKMLIIHLHVDCRDAMGANAVNTMAETVAPYLEELTGGKAYLRIISNLAVHRTAWAEALFSRDELGEDVVEGVLNAYAFAAADPYRCATHNKGIMNGVSAVVLATGNDTRAIEAGAHAYAAYKGGYAPLTRYERNDSGDLVGRIELPVAVGLIGGATAVHPVAKANVRILGVKTASELGEVLAAVGLAQNFAALRALASEGIQKGHMKLHARNIAVMAGAPPELVDRVAERLAEEGRVRMDRAKEIVEELKRKKGSKA